MRLALLIYDDLDKMSGGYLYDRMLVDFLRRSGDEVDVVSVPWRSYVRHLGDNASSRLLNRLSDASFEVVLQDELNHPSLFWLNRRLRKRKPVPIVSIVHHLRSSETWPAWQRGLYTWVERSYLRTVDGLVYNSQNTRRQVELLLGSEPASVVSLPGKDHLRPSLTDGRIRERCLESGPLRVLFVGNVIRRKGLHVLVDALAALAPGTCRLTVAGSTQSDPRYAAGVRQRVRSLGLESAVRFHGSAAPTRLQALYETHHVLAIPSAHEGFGIAYLEAAGFGLPSIAPPSGGAGEFVRHGVTGFVLPPIGGAVAEHLLKWHLDRGLLMDMSLAARQAYEAHPTWDQGSAQTRRFLQGPASR
jgi:glycosyltransferase involved in cell wall biosynthesis